MKKILFLLLALLMIPGAVYAEDLSASLIQPGIYNAKKGQNLDYQLDLNFKDGYEKRLKSFSVSLMMDPNLKVKEAKVEDLKENTSWQLTTSNLDGKDVINFSVDQVDFLQGRKSLRLNIATSLKKDLDGKGDLKNTYVLYYMDKSGKESSDQKDLITTPSQEKQGLEIKPLTEDSSILEGKGPKNAKIRLLKGDTLLGEGFSTEDGSFQIVINPQAKGTSLTVEAISKDQGKIREKLVVGEDKNSSKDPAEAGKPEESLKQLTDLVNYAKSLSTKGRSIEEINRLKAMVAYGEYLEVKTDVGEEEIKNHRGQLLASIQAVQPPFMKGISKDRFAPDASMTRAEVASVIYQLKGKRTLPYMSSYKDVDQEKWYAEAVGFVEDQGYMQGVGGGLFAPDRKVTKAEFAAVVSKAFGIREEEDFWVRPVEEEKAFSDVASSHWAYKAILALKKEGILTGDQTGLFHPNKTMTRSEGTTILLRGMYTESPIAKKYGVNPFKDLKESHWAYGIILQATGNDLKKFEQ